MAALTRIALIGAESTGKSILAAELGQRLGAPVVQEFAREYALRVQRNLDFFDVFPIARGQMANEDAVIAASPSRVVILDTDLMSTVAYSRHYWGVCPDWIEKAARERRATLYLLMECDVPWVADRARDASAKREDVHGEFVRVLKEMNARSVSISGTWVERRERAIEALRAATLIA